MLRQTHRCKQVAFSGFYAFPDNWTDLAHHLSSISLQFVEAKMSTIRTAVYLHAVLVVITVFRFPANRFGISFAYLALWPRWVMQSKEYTRWVMQSKRDGKKQKCLYSQRRREWKSHFLNPRKEYLILDSCDIPVVFFFFRYSTNQMKTFLEVRSPAGMENQLCTFLLGHCTWTSRHKEKRIWEMVFQSLIVRMSEY